MEWTIYTPITETVDQKTTMRAKIDGCEGVETLFYTVPNMYASYLCTERADAFLVPLLPKAMMWAKKSGQPLTLVCEQPVSSKLYHQLINYYIPVLCKNISYYAPVCIEAPIAQDTLPCAGAVGTGISGGVDSSYTIAKYATPSQGKYQLTHGVFFNVGIYGGYDSAAEKLLEEKAQIIANATNIQYLCLQTNTCKELYQKAHAPVVPFVFTGAALALQKLFSTYYYSSGFCANEMYFSEADAAYYDWLNVACFSSDNTTFYSSGIEAKRLEKVDFIKDYPFTYKNLSVCLTEEQGNGNCGKCAKCTRTMAELEALEVLDRYNKVFDVNAFRSNPEYQWGYILLKGKADPFCGAILKRYKESGRKLPFAAYWGAFKKYAARGFTSTNKKRERVEK